MNRIDAMFTKLRKQGRKAFIPFVTAGDPDLATTRRLVLEMEKNGANLIELGVPFTDPMAEGPVIQAANLRALQNDVSLDRLFEFVVHLREETQIPLVFLMYYNSLLHYGQDAFFARCKEAGIDGVILPDLPFEESDEISEYTERYGVYQISLVAPTSYERLQQITAKAKGFLYCVSSLGVTGMRSEIRTDLAQFFAEIDRCCAIPTCIGFGISTPEQAAAVKQYCDGVIIGSAIVNRIGTAQTPDRAVASVAEFVRQVSEAIAN